MTVTSFNPRTGQSQGVERDSSTEDVRAALERAASVAPAAASAPPTTRAAWLDAIASALEANAEHLVEIADSETALGEPRLSGELARCAASARFYGSVAVAGDYLNARIDAVAGPPAVTLARVEEPLGPVAVFGASNFPFGFGVLGHDTCSALAAGCPVVVKAHPAHPALSAALAQVATDALAAAGAPEGLFGMVAGFDAGLALVDAPEIAAVGFTGSQRGGMALLERARGREREIPVFAEMGTVNPVVVTPAAAARIDEIAEGFVGSFTLGQGQFCTKPGLLLVPAGCGAEGAVAAAVGATQGGWLLTSGIAAAYDGGVDELAAAGARTVAQGESPEVGYAATPTLLAATTAQLTPGSRLLEECFGPVGLVVEYADLDEALEVLARLQPSLAGAVQAGTTAETADADPDLSRVVDALARQVGRVLVGGWPTGVAVTWGMHHGGPWPATSRPEATSVGAHALDRWVRPVSFQDVPDVALPPALQAANPWGNPVTRTGAGA